MGGTLIVHPYCVFMQQSHLVPLSVRCAFSAACTAKLCIFVGGSAPPLCSESHGVRLTCSAMSEPASRFVNGDTVSALLDWRNRRFAQA